MRIKSRWTWKVLARSVAESVVVEVMKKLGIALALQYSSFLVLSSLVLSLSNSLVTPILSSPLSSAHDA